MSFLGYIGKSLGAGTAPIRNANLTSSSDIEFREFRDNAPNREELTRIEMQKRRDAEAERVRGQEYIQSLRGGRLLTPDPGTGVEVNINPAAPAAPTTLPPVPRPAGLTTTAAASGTDPMAQAFAGKIPSGLTVDQSIARDNPYVVRLNSLNAQIDTSNARLAEIKKERTKAQMERAGTRRTGARSQSDTSKLKALNQEEKTLTAAVTSIQSEVNRLTASQPTVAPAAGLAVTAPAAAPAAAPVAGLAAPAAAPAAGGPVDLRPTGVAPAAPAAVPSGYEQFRPAVETVAPQLGFNLDEANTLMAGLGYGESRFNAGAKSPSGTYTGAYQLGPAIVSQYGPRVEKRFGYSPTSPEGQAAMALMLAADNKKALVAKGLEASSQNLALAHNQGATGAAALLQNPSMPVGEALDKFAPEKTKGAKRASGQAWMKGQDVSTTTAGEFVERAAAYYGKYSPEFSGTPGFEMNINPDVYATDPEGLTFDMERLQFSADLIKQQREFMLNTIDASDPTAARTQMGDVFAMSEKLVQLDGIYAQLQITKGLTAAYGGDTSYLSAVLSAAMDYPIEATAYAGEQGIVYQITAGGQPVSDYISYDQMKQFTMRMANSEYDAELTTLEVAAAAKANEITMQLNADVQKILAQGNVNLALAEFSAEKDAVLAELDAKFARQGEGVGLKELTVASNGDILVTDSRGRVYKVTTRQEKIGGKKQDITSLEPVDVRGLN